MTIRPNIALVLSWSIATLPQCRKEIVTTEQYEPSDKYAFDSSDKLIDGDRLMSRNLVLSSQMTGTHNALKIKADADLLADFQQYVVCQQADTSKCAPSPDKPGEFPFGFTIVPNPPSGAIKVDVRSCIRPEKASNPERLCGPWIASTIMQPVNKDPRLVELLTKKKEADDKIKFACQKAHASITQYLKERDTKAQSSKLQEIYNIIETAKEMGEDVCAGVMSTADLADAEEQAKAAGWGRNPSAGGIALLVLGGSSIIGGAIVIGLGMRESQRIRYQIKETLTKTLEQPTAVETPPKANITTHNLESLEELLNKLDKVRAAESKVAQVKAASSSFEKNNLDFLKFKPYVLNKVEYLRTLQVSKENGITSYHRDSARDTRPLAEIEAEWSLKTISVNVVNPFKDSIEEINFETDPRFKADVKSDLPDASMVPWSTVEEYYRLDAAKQDANKNLKQVLADNKGIYDHLETDVQKKAQHLFPDKIDPNKPVNVEEIKKLIGGASGKVGVDAPVLPRKPLAPHVEIKRIDADFITKGGLSKPLLGAGIVLISVGIGAVVAGGLLGLADGSDPLAALLQDLQVHYKNIWKHRIEIEDVERALAEHLAEVKEKTTSGAERP